MLPFVLLFVEFRIEQSVLVKLTVTQFTEWIEVFITFGSRSHLRGEVSHTHVNVLFNLKTSAFLWL